MYLLAYLLFLMNRNVQGDASTYEAQKE